MRKKNQFGFSLLELLISLAISVVFVGAAASLLARNKTDYVPLRDIARMNEGAMAAFEIVTKELEQAGFFGENPAFKKADLTGANASTGVFVNHIFNANTNPPAQFLFGLGRARNGVALRSTAIEGYEGTTPANGFLPSGTLVFDDQTSVNDPDTGILPGTDAITIRGSFGGRVNIMANSARTGAQVGMKGEGVLLAQDSNAGATNLIVDDASGLPRRGYFVVYDGLNSELFKGTVAGNTITIIQDPAPGAIASPTFSNAYSSNTDGSVNFESGQAFVTVARFARYYIGNYVTVDGDKVPSLYREFYNSDPAVDRIVRTDQVLIEGVENMQITYGLDTGGAAGIDTYTTADQVDTLADWSMVKALKISLLVRSETQSSVDPTTGSKQYQVNDQLITPGTTDKYSRKVYNVHVALDNGV